MMTPDSIFSGPAIVTLLALVIALAVYLRAVFADTQDTIEDVLTDEKKHLFPKPDRHREKLKLLTTTNTYIEVITPYVFVFCVIIALRLIAATFIVVCTSASHAQHTGCYYSELTQCWLRSVDYFISIGLAVLILGMWAAHHFLKNVDKELRYGIYADFSDRETDENTKQLLMGIGQHRKKIECRVLVVFLILCAAISFLYWILFSKA
jgi:hypothetical protein